MSDRRGAGVRLRLFAAAREAAGRAEDVFEPTSLGDLLAQARRRYGDEFAAVLAGARVWVNEDEPSAGDATRLVPGDEVAVLPPVSGGCDDADACERRRARSSPGRATATHLARRAGSRRVRSGHEPRAQRVEVMATVAMERIEALLSPGYSDRLGDRSDDELRAKKQECVGIETTVSYYRRLAQGRIEILAAWREQRRGGGSMEDLLADLPRILAAGGARPAATTSRFSPADGPIGELTWADGREHLVADETLANLAVLDGAALDAQLEDLRAFEQELSGIRRSLHRVIDRLEGELADRQAADVG